MNYWGMFFIGLAILIFAVMLPLACKDDDKDKSRTMKLMRINGGVR
ncbi:MAG TPA: hypothetical protein GXX19_02010 [Syntrophomonadaceae bacterium]|nr:hypothetical protein [Syntrophomonadaceae bacterium]